MIGPCALLLLEETHSNSKVEQKQKEDFHGKVFFSHSFTIKKQKTDDDGRILILDVSIKDSKYILIKIYIADTGKEQIEALSKFFALLKAFDIDPNKHLIMAGDFHLFIDSKLDETLNQKESIQLNLSKLIIYVIPGEKEMQK